MFAFLYSGGRYSLDHFGHEMRGRAGSLVEWYSSCSQSQIMESTNN